VSSKLLLSERFLQQIPCLVERGWLVILLFRRIAILSATSHWLTRFLAQDIGDRLIGHTFGETTSCWMNTGLCLMTLRDRRVVIVFCYYFSLIGIFSQLRRALDAPRQAAGTNGILRGVIGTAWTRVVGFHKGLHTVGKDRQASESRLILARGRKSRAAPQRIMTATHYKHEPLALISRTPSLCWRSVGVVSAS
jgi:hypothetical protein